MIRAWGVTDKGVIRSQNQDGYYLDVLSERLAVGVVCDGMGGARAGNIASLIAVETFVDTLKNLRPEQEEAPAAALDRAAVAANEAVFRRACTDPDCRGMGTTMVAVLVVEDTAYLLNIGDSRAYHIDRDGITRLTRDHSVVQELVDGGSLSSEESRNHPKKNIITRALGTQSSVNIDYFKVALVPGDKLLLCSDGLSNMLEEQQICALLQKPDAAKAVDALIEASLDAGANDNVTAVLISR